MLLRTRPYDNVQTHFYFYNCSGIKVTTTTTTTTTTTEVVPVLYQTPRHQGVLVEWRYSSTHSLNSGVDGSEWSASRPGRFTPRETAPGAHWIGGWVGPRAVLDTVVKRKIPSPRQESNPRTPIV
jgi:hypothetical protein